MSSYTNQTKLRVRKDKDLNGAGMYNIPDRWHVALNHSLDPSPLLLLLYYSSSYSRDEEPKMSPRDIRIWTS